MKQQAIEKLQAYNKEDSFKVVINYIINRVQGLEDDSVFIQNICNEKKSVEEMISYILQEAHRKANSSAAMFEDSEVYGWAVHYFDELDLKVEKAPVQAKVTTSAEPKVDESKKEIVLKKPKKSNKEQDLYGNTTLFDF